MFLFLIVLQFGLFLILIFLISNQKLSAGVHEFCYLYRSSFDIPSLMTESEYFRQILAVMEQILEFVPFFSE